MLNSTEWNTNLKPLVFGFLLSGILTLAAYALVMEPSFSNGKLLLMIGALGALQAIIQLVLFLHVGIESKPYWNLICFLFMLLVVVVVIGGSLWIMYNLNYHTLS